MIRRVFFVICLLSIFLPITARACSCSKEAPGACAGLQKDDVVFTGTVTDIEVLPAAASVANSGDTNAPGASGAPSGSGALPVTRYHFHIDEGFAGPGTGAEIDIFSGGDDGDCGYQFQEGRQYIVFTEQENEGRLFATICNGTRPASEGRALVPQLRAMRNGTHVASVFGILHRSDPPFLAPADDPADPLPHIALRLRSKDDRFSTSTGPDGVYSFYDVHAGEYSFTANLPVRMELSQKTLTGGLPPFKIPNGACYEYDVDALPTGHIRGSVLGPDGKPLPVASIELYRAGQYDDARPGLWAFQGAKGAFDFDHVGPGEYIVVFNRMNRVDPNAPFPRSFYPGVLSAANAEPIKLKDGEQLMKLNMKLGKGYPTRTVRVGMKWEHGKPPGDVTVMAQADRGENPAARKISEDLYEFTLLESAHYLISAWEDLLPQQAPAHKADTECVVPAKIETVSVTVDGSDPETKQVTLSFAAVECGKQESTASQ